MDVIVCVLALFLFIFGEYEISEAILNGKLFEKYILFL